MSEPTKKILLHQQPSTPLKEEKLQAYLAGLLSVEEQHEVEQWLASEGMEADALEGLQTINPDETKHMVHRVNHRLKKQLKLQRKKHGLKGMEWSWLAVIILMLLAIVAYWVLHIMLQK